MDEILFARRMGIEFHGKITKKNEMIINHIIDTFFVNSYARINIILKNKDEIIKISKNYIGKCDGTSLIFDYSFNRMLFNFARLDIFLNKKLLKKEYGKKKMATKFINMFLKCMPEKENMKDIIFKKVFDFIEKL
ncbi:hypothetical protein VFPYRCLA_014 [Candidatus Vidania fulgoroideae]|nr:hypothetical protein VFPYRCLA_014 [Candidatus Vidania fulgoroideae]